MGLFGIFTQQEARENFKKVREDYGRLDKEYHDRLVELSEVITILKTDVQILKETAASKAELVDVKNVLQMMTERNKAEKTVIQTEAITPFQKPVKLYIKPDVSKIKTLIKTLVSKGQDLASVKKEIVNKLGLCTKPSFYRYVKQMSYT